MHILKKMLFVVFTFTILLSITACGYRPSSYYAKKEMEGNVFVNINVSLEDPKNSVLVKDAIIKLLIQKLDSKLVSEQSKADVIMNISISSVSLQTLQYDSSGYNKLYKAVVVLGVIIQEKIMELKNHLQLMENMISLLIMEPLLQRRRDLMPFQMHQIRH